jgi:hypothetical protein
LWAILSLGIWGGRRDVRRLRERSILGRKTRVLRRFNYLIRRRQQKFSYPTHNRPVGKLPFFFQIGCRNCTIVSVAALKTTMLLSDLYVKFPETKISPKSKSESSVLTQVTQLAGTIGAFSSDNADFWQKSSLHLYHLVDSTQPLRQRQA